MEATEAEGPGLRFALWTQGCSLRCPGCCNPHTWNPSGGRTTTVAELLARVDAARARRPRLEGVSLLGGEPFEQDDALADLAARVRARGLTVMAYSGYRLEELRARGSRLLAHCDLLVDGRYVASLRTTQRRFVGSTNQRLHFLSAAYTPDDPRFHAPNTAELRLDADGVLRVVGFPFASILAAFGPGARGPRESGATSGSGPTAGAAKTHSPGC